MFKLKSRKIFAEDKFMTPSEALFKYINIFVKTSALDSFSLFDRLLRKWNFWRRTVLGMEEWKG